VRRADSPREERENELEDAEGGETKRVRQMGPATGSWYGVRDPEDDGREKFSTVGKNIPFRGGFGV
jgi:hypothetical protein